MPEDKNQTTERELIRFLRRALELTKRDAERNGFQYGRRSVCQRALDAAKVWEARLANG